MRSTFEKHGAAVACAMVLGLASTRAHAVHFGDIILTVEGGSMWTNVQVGAEYAHERVFATTLGLSSPDFTDSPGFDCEPGTFPYPGSISFVVPRALRVWNGTAFAEIAASQMLIEFGPLSATTPQTDAPVAGFSLQVGSNGEWHRHLGYTLLPPADPGTYLLELQLSSQTTSLQGTGSFWIIFDEGLGGTELHRASAWARVHLAGECPADLDDGSGLGIHDGGVDINDLLYFLAAFEAGAPAADLDDGQGQGLPDEGVDVNDLLYFLARFEQGC